MMSSKKRKYKTYYFNSSKKQKLIPSHSKGFLCTCNRNEKDCVKEALNLLDEYCPELKIGNSNDEGNQSTGEDIESEIKNEAARLSQTDRDKIFHVINTGIPGVVFIKALVKDPVDIAYSVASETKNTKVRKTKNLIRLIPVEVTCRANIDEIKKAAEKLFETHFKVDPVTFSVIVSLKHNNSILKDELIHSLAVLVRDRNINHKVDLKDPEKTVLVHVMKGMCCLSVAPKYLALKKYNLYELSRK